MWKTASASPPSGGRPRLVADHTHREPCKKIARAGTFYPPHSREVRVFILCNRCQPVVATSSLPGQERCACDRVAVRCSTRASSGFLGSCRSQQRRVETTWLIGRVPPRCVRSAIATSSDVSRLLPPRLRKRMQWWRMRPHNARAGSSSPSQRPPAARTIAVASFSGWASSWIGPAASPFVPTLLRRRREQPKSLPRPVERRVGWASGHRSKSCYACAVCIRTIEQCAPRTAPPPCFGR